MDNISGGWTGRGLGWTVTPSGEGHEVKSKQESGPQGPGTLFYPWGGFEIFVYVRGHVCL